MIKLLRLLILTPLTLSCICNGGANAGLFISIANTTIAPGGSGSVDVTVQSDAASGDLLSQFGFEFRISTLGATQLDFANPQGDSELGDATYIFSGDSLANTAPPVGAVISVVVPNDAFVGGDATFSGVDVTVGTSARLLARLDLATLTALPPADGDSFSIELIAGQNTFFQDSEFRGIVFQSSAGTITVAVPEPSGAVLLICGLSCLVLTILLRGGARRASIRGCLCE